MSLIWLYSLGSVIIISLISLIGLFTISINREWLYKIIYFLVALAVGALLGDVLVHILPELWVEKGHNLSVSVYIFAGFLIFFVIEKFLRWHHSHGLESEESHHHDDVKHVGYMSLISDGVHNLIDGVLIGTSYMISVEIGVATTIAVILHEIPQDIGDFGLLLHAGFSRRRALFFNFLSALTAVLGTIIALLIGTKASGFAESILPITAGGFLYIAAADLVPELHKVSGPAKSVVQFFGVVAGFAVMVLLLAVE